MMTARAHRKLVERRPAPISILVRRCQFCHGKFVRHGVLLPLSEACDSCREKVLKEANPARAKRFSRWNDLN